MPGLGTVVNSAAIIIAGLIGLTFGKGLTERYQETMLSACGLSTLFISIGGVMSGMLVLTESGLSTQGSVMMAASLVLGAFIGEAINIEKHMTDFGEWLKAKTGSHGDGSFVSSFVTTSLVVSIGAMAVLGPINEGIYGDRSVLYAKSILDLILILLMTLTHGKGCIFSFIPVLMIQGAVTVLASLIKPLMIPEAVSGLNLVGSVLIASLGINMVWDRHIRVANMFPSVIVAIIWAFVAEAMGL